MNFISTMVLALAMSTDAFAASVGKGAALQPAVTFQRLQRIGRAGGLKAAAMANPWAQEQAVGADGQGGKMGKRRHDLWIRASAPCRSASSSAKSRSVVTPGLATST